MMPDLFEIAQQVATPDYAAAAVAVIETKIANAHIAIEIAVAVVLLCAVTAIASIRKIEKCEECKYEDLLWGVFGLALFIGAIALVVLFANFTASLALQEDLANWTCDPVTEIVKSLALAI